MAWPGDAGGAPVANASGGFDMLGMAFKVGPELIGMLPAIRAAIDTVERYMNDPELKKLIAESPQIVAFAQKVMNDPAVKAAVATAEKTSAILAKAR
jgi:hypothetical protein